MLDFATVCTMILVLVSVWLPGQELKLSVEAGPGLDVAGLRQDLHVVPQLRTHLECQPKSCARSAIQQTTALFG